MMEPKKLSEQARAKIEKAGIPVDSRDGRTAWVLYFDDESEDLPTDLELKQLRSYVEFIVTQHYNETYQHKMLVEKPFAACGGHNTMTFRKGTIDAPNNPEIKFRPTNTGWQFQRASWVVGPPWFPSITADGFYPRTLIEILDHEQKWTKGLSPHWEKWKKDHADIFGT